MISMYFIVFSLRRWVALGPSHPQVERGTDRIDTVTGIFPEVPVSSGRTTRRYDRSRMEHSVETPGAAATGPEAAVAAERPASGADRRDEQPEPEGRKRRLPEWWHRDHPVFVPLAGFFVGMAYVIVVPGTYVAIVNRLVGFERGDELFPFVLLTLAVPIGLIVPPRTRRFGGYMLFGVLSTAVVVLGVAAAVLGILIARDS
ncbi:hypothetical protein [Nocardioides sp. TF02-7]|uniref:hypothetical protein n=1 Tax=Nocardioides sp. TF02-7 TaxID=2917724 RepID=UPI001F0631A1|nr:hypothetical protein [Nocardioides sp. TF02-7]UMG93005.1 hypothetical protein MF408_01210 [Nocardioides sp. TF02-7]